MIKEELRRIATPVGNGSHILVPKEWEGYEVVLTKLAEIDPKKEILSILYPYLANVIGVYIYGSYARKEQGKSSDIDILVITDKKITPVEVKKPFDVTFVEKNKIEAFKKLNPVLFYSILFEAEPVLNEDFLYELRNKEIKAKFKQHLKDYIEDTAQALSIDKQLLDKSEKNADASLVYSVILRLRGIFIIENLLKKQMFSNESFLEILRKNVRDPQAYYDLYRAVRDNKTPKGNVEAEEAEKLIKLLDRQLRTLKRKINAK